MKSYSSGQEQVQTNTPFFMQSNFTWAALAQKLRNPDWEAGCEWSSEPNPQHPLLLMSGRYETGPGSQRLSHHPSQQQGSEGHWHSPSPGYQTPPQRRWWAEDGYDVGSQMGQAWQDLWPDRAGCEELVTNLLQHCWGRGWWPQGPTWGLGPWAGWGEPWGAPGFSALLLTFLIASCWIFNLSRVWESYTCLGIWQRNHSSKELNSLCRQTQHFLIFSVFQERLWQEVMQHVQAARTFTPARRLWKWYLCSINGRSFNNSGIASSRVIFSLILPSRSCNFSHLSLT